MELPRYGEEPISVEVQLHTPQVQHYQPQPQQQQQHSPSPHPTSPENIDPVEAFVTATQKPDQFRACFYKNVSFQKRQKWTNCCQLCLPLTMVVLIGIINIVLGNYIINQGIDNQAGQIIRGQPYLISWLQRPYEYHLYADESNPKNPDLGYLQKNGNKSGILSMIPQNNFTFITQTVDLSSGERVPFFIEYDNANEVDAAIVEVKDRLYRRQRDVSSRNDPPQFNTNYTEPTTAIVFKKLDTVNLQLEYTALAESDSDFLQYNYPFLNNYGLTAEGNIINKIHNAIIKFIINSALYIDTIVQPLPYKKLKTVFDVGGYLTAVLFPFAFSFLLPVFVHGLVVEKQEKLVEMMKMAGLKMKWYYGITFLFNFILYLIIALLVIIIGCLFQLSFFLRTSGVLTFLMFLGWGLNQVSMAFILSCFFSKARTATIVCYMLVIASALASIITAFTVFADKEAHPAYFIWPPFAFYRYIYLTGTNCGSDRCPQLEDMGPNSEYAKSLLVLYIEAFLFLVLFGYLDQVIPKEFGVSKSPFFPFTSLYSYCKNRKSGVVEEDVELMDTARSAVIDDDADVAAERKIVETLKMTDLNKYPVLIQNLNKQYGEKTAVVNLCLSMNQNECFGLLGPNGAGKTTTISICTGLYGPTAGTAYIDGYDIRTEMDNIHQSLGICPQFDILWETLSCKETLLFYCRIKGVSKSSEQKAAMQCLAQVGLQEAANKMVSELSGGMKRRLSVAVCLVGNPKVIFLDEPTTGLDPDSRRQLWNVLLKVRVGKCVVLTTHSMEEADVLCNRIGIMSRGTLKAVGTNVRLKSKYGQGYSLKLNFNVDDTDKVKQYIESIAPSSELTESFPGNYTYQIPGKDFVMSKILSDLIEKKNQIIKDWGLSQTTLEDVFLNIVKQDE